MALPVKTMSDADVGLEPTQPQTLSDADVGLAGGAGPLANAPQGDSTEAALGKGAATATLKGLGHIPGVLGDVREARDYLGARAYQAVTGTPADEGLQALAAWRKRHPVINAALDPVSMLPAGHDVSDPVLARTGEYKPTTGVGRAVMAGVETGVSMLGPGAIAGGLRAGKAGLEGAMPIAREVLRSSTKPVAVGVTGGVAGDVATQITDDPLAGMVAGALVPGAGGRIAKRTIGRYTAPMFPSNWQALADEKLLKTADSPAKVLADARFQPREIVEGAPGTLGEVTGDRGILRAQKAARNASGDFEGEMQQIEGQGNAARVKAVNDMAPGDVDMNAPAKSFQTFLQHLDNQTEAAAAQAEATAKTHAAAIPGQPAEMTGARLRSTLAGIRDQARTARARLYEAVDPDGKLQIVTRDARSAAQKIQEALDPDFTEVSEHAAPVLKRMANLQDVTSFKNVMQLDTMISTKMAQARRAQDFTGLEHLRQMKAAIMGDVNNAVENHAKFQTEQVQAGHLPEEETFAANLQRQIDEYRAGRADRATAVGATAGDGTGTVPGPGRATGTPGGGPRDVAGTEGLSGGEGFDPEAAARLKAAKEAHGAYAQTYRQGPVGEGLRENKFAGQYMVPDARIASRVLPGGEAGGEVTRSWLDASRGSADALSAIQDMATTKLQQAMKGDVLTPAELAAWKTKYGPSLAEIDKASPGFSNRFDTAAKASQALEDAQVARTRALSAFEDSSAARFLEANHPDEATRAIASVIRSGPTEMQQLMDQVGKLPAKERAATAMGLKKLAVNHLLNTFSNASVSGGERALSGAKLMGFLDRYAGSLEPLFGKDGLGNMHALAADAERMAAARDIQTTKLGSDTFKNWMMEKGLPHGSTIGIMGLAMLEGGEALMHGDIATAVGAAGVAATKHLLEMARGRGIRNVKDLYMQGLLDPDVGAAMMERALDAKGNLRAEAVNDLATALGRSAIIGQEETRRPGRASGGAVLNHKAEAEKLIREIATARKAEGKTTKPILNVPDETVVHALAIANEAI